VPKKDLEADHGLVVRLGRQYEVIESVDRGRERAMSLLRDSLVALPLSLKLSEVLLLIVKIIVGRSSRLSTLMIVHLLAHSPDITQGTQTNTLEKELDQKLFQATRRTMQLLRSLRWDLTYQQLL
jgi:hypothetical protein